MGPDSRPARVEAKRCSSARHPPSHSSQLAKLVHSINTSLSRAYELPTMDVVQAVSGYVTKMVSAGDSASGGAAVKMKILLLDSETVGLSLSDQVYEFSAANLA